MLVSITRKAAVAAVFSLAVATTARAQGVLPEDDRHSLGYVAHHNLANRVLSVVATGAGSMR